MYMDMDIYVYETPTLKWLKWPIVKNVPGYLNVNNKQGTT